MKPKVLVSILLLVILVFSITSERGIQAQGEAPDSAFSSEIQADITPLIGYQGRLSIDGVPAEGSYSMTFKLFTAVSGGIAEWEETKVVPVSKGLFQTALGDTSPLDASHTTLSKNLWLEITVAGATLPRQRLLGAPYALTLAPGAVINYTASFPSMNINNNGTGAALHTTTQSGYSLWGSSSSNAGVYGESSTGPGVKAESSGAGLNNAALKAEALETGGIAVWAKSNSWDSTLVTSNDGDGPLMKGFGKDGDEHEFIIENDGSFKQEIEASGLVKAAVYALCGGAGSKIERSFNNVLWSGPMTITNGSASGTCLIDFGFSVYQRYFMVTAPGVTGYAQMAFAACTLSDPYPTKLGCARMTHEGNLIDGYIMILVY